MLLHKGGAGHRGADPFCSGHSLGRGFAGSGQRAASWQQGAFGPRPGWGVWVARHSTHFVVPHSSEPGSRGAPAQLRPQASPKSSLSHVPSVKWVSVGVAKPHLPGPLGVGSGGSCQEQWELEGCTCGVGAGSSHQPSRWRGSGPRDHPPPLEPAGSSFSPSTRNPRPAAAQVG